VDSRTDPAASGVTTFALLSVPRDTESLWIEDRAKYLTWLREPLQQLEFVVGGRSLRELLQELEVPEPETYGFPDDFGLLSVADLAWPRCAASALRQLAGVEARDDAELPLETGRLPLYVCPMCGDLGCGAVTVAVLWAPDGTRVTWCDFRMEDGYSDDRETIDLGALGPFVFDADDYRKHCSNPSACSTPSPPTRKQRKPSTGGAVAYAVPCDVCCGGDGCSPTPRR
jgi:hypothetical protein